MMAKLVPLICLRKLDFVIEINVFFVMDQHDLWCVCVCRNGIRLISTSVEHISPMIQPANLHHDDETTVSYCLIINLGDEKRKVG